MDIRFMICFDGLNTFLVLYFVFPIIYFFSGKNPLFNYLWQKSLKIKIIEFYNFLFLFDLFIRNSERLWYSLHEKQINQNIHAVMRHNGGFVTIITEKKTFFFGLFLFF